MPKTIEAVYENGVFRPLQKLELREKEKVEIKVERSLTRIIEDYQKKFKLKREDVENFLKERR